MNREKLHVARCRCGCGKWAVFRRRPQFNADGVATALGVYADSWVAAVRAAIAWTTKQTL